MSEEFARNHKWQVGTWNPTGVVLLAKIFYIRGGFLLLTIDGYQEKRPQGSSPRGQQGMVGESVC